MHKRENIYTPKSGQVIRWVGLLIPVFIILYGTLVKLDVIYTFRSINDFTFYLISLLWTIVSIMQFIIPTRNDRNFGLFLLAYHFLSAVYIILIVGTVTPLVACWSVLSLSSYVYASRRGYIYSSLALLATIVCDIALWFSVDSVVLIQDSIAILLTMIISASTISIAKTQEVSKTKFKQSKAKEILQRDRVLTIINNLADAILSTDMDGIIKIYNASSMGLLDTNANLNGKHIDEILPLYNQDGEKVSLFRELKRSKTVIKRDDLEYRFNEDEKMRLEITLSPIRSSYKNAKNLEPHDGYIIIMRDVTKAKSLEEERDEFISVTSHELRTPITIAEGTLSNMQIMIDHPNVTHSMLSDAVNTAHDQIIFLANMVNDLSTLSRAERGVADTAEIIDVRELAQKMYDKYKSDAEKKGLHLNIDLAPKLGKIKVSRLYVEELLQNFITNSIKYTKDGSITIVAEQKDDQAIFTIKDTGIGISKSDQQKVFNKFFRSEDYRTRETGGTGLGLYIAAKLSRKIGTQIKLVSRLNFGSSFSFSLPIIDESEEKAS